MGTWDRPGWTRWTWDSIGGHSPGWLWVGSAHPLNLKCLDSLSQKGQILLMSKFLLLFPSNNGILFLNRLFCPLLVTQSVNSGLQKWALKGSLCGLELIEIQGSTATHLGQSCIDWVVYLCELWVLWILWILWSRGSCGSHGSCGFCGSYGAMDLVSPVHPFGPVSRYDLVPGSEHLSALSPHFTEHHVSGLGHNLPE